MTETDRKFRWTGKTILLAVFGVVVLGSIITGIIQGAMDDGEADAVAETPQADTTPVPDYEIVETEDLTFGDTVRFQYRVRVSGEPTEAELRAVIDDVLEQAKGGPPFNAVSIGLYGEDDEVMQAYTLGVAEFAPGGDWGAADSVDAGDYDAMELVVDIY